MKGFRSFFECFIGTSMSVETISDNYKIIKCLGSIFGKSISVFLCKEFVFYTNLPVK